MSFKEYEDIKDMHKKEIIKRLNSCRAYCSFWWDGNSYDKVRYNFLSQSYDIIYDAIIKINKLQASIEEKSN